MPRPLTDAETAYLTAKGKYPPPKPPRPRTTGTLWMERVSTAGLLCRSCTAGCGVAVCHAGKGDAQGRVTMSRCIQCLKECDAP